LKYKSFTETDMNALKYGTYGQRNYSQVKSEDDDRETASERHSFSLIPIGIALSFTIGLIYTILVMKHFSMSS
jgi:hypothetical protein